MSHSSNLNFQLLESGYLPDYEKQVVGLDFQLAKLVPKRQFSSADFEHYILTSAVFSSNIEGNTLDVDTFLKNKHFNIRSKPKEMAEIEDLIAAYNFAIPRPLSKKNFLKTHQFLSRTILSVRQQRGKLRNQPVGIFSGGQLEYLAVEPAYVQQEFDKLFTDVESLLANGFRLEEPPEIIRLFYFAAMIHLAFEKIHPFMDGNGRAGRLLEKWFLASVLGNVAWGILSEKYYAINRSAYYQNIHIGFDYYNLRWDRCLPFLLMLPQAVLSSSEFKIPSQ
jgi:Fic family protein